MKRHKIKCIKVNVGDDIIVMTPSHPLSIAIQIKAIIDRILALDDNEFEYSCNSLDGLAVFHHYGQGSHPKEISVTYYVNGKKATYEEAVADLERGKQYVEQLIGQNNDCTRSI